MQAKWRSLCSEAPKSQGCAAEKKRVEINQHRAQIVANRFFAEAVRHAFNCADDGHVLDLPNGSSRIKILHTRRIGARALTNGERCVHQYEKKVPIRPCFRAILQCTATVLLTLKPVSSRGQHFAPAGAILNGQTSSSTCRPWRSRRSTASCREALRRFLPADAGPACVGWS